MAARGQKPARPGRAASAGNWRFGKNATALAMALGGLKGMDAWVKIVAQRAREGKVTIKGTANYFALVGTGAEVPYTRAHEKGSGLFASFGPKKKIRIWAGKLNPTAGGTKSLDPKWSLSFKWKGGPDPHPALQTAGPFAGYYSFAYVDHPGVKASHFLQDAVEGSTAQGRILVLIAINNALKARPGKALPK